jgi:hypothetical protein
MSDVENSSLEYVTTPRKLDEELKRKARGNRGCLGDALSAAGALLAFALGVTASLGMTPMGWALVPVAVLIMGFIVGTRSQSSSGKSRTKALEEGPLAFGAVLRAEDSLYSEGRRAGRAAVFFFASGSERLDAEETTKQARRVLQIAASRIEEPWARMISGAQPFGFEAVPPELIEHEDAYVADVVIYPNLLDGGALPQLEASVRVIVSPSERFVEHV